MSILKKFISILLTLVMLLSLNIPAFAEEKTLNFLSLGDSIAAGAGLANPNKQAYGAIVSNTNGYNFKNDAISGHTTQNMIKRINQKKVAEDIKEADIICISIGGNNFLQSNLAELMIDATAKKDYSKFDEIADGLYADIDIIIPYIRGLNPDATILFQTLYNPMYVSKDLREAYQAGADRVNDTIRRYTEEHENVYTVVEVAAAIGDDESLITADYIHPNSKGHVVIAREVLKVLKDMGLGTETEPAFKEIKISTLFDTFLFKIRQLLNKIFAFMK